MIKKQRGVLVFSIFMVAAMVVSACTQSLSQAPVATPTLIPTGLFVSPFPSVENPMAMIEEFAKQTAAAQTAAAGGSPATTTTPDPAAAVTGTPGTPSGDIPSATATISNSTPTNVGAVSVTPGVPATSVPVGSRPASYTLQKGEFPYCIARRYNLDPNELLSLNGLSVTDAYNLPSGTVLKIPQSGTFPGSRALASHPASYTVASGDETVYSVACKFGDVDPNALASANSISVSAVLTTGQQLQIP